MIVHYMVGFREICFATAALPLVTLFVSFVGAVIFQAEETHETHCQVSYRLDLKLIYKSTNQYTDDQLLY